MQRLIPTRSVSEEFIAYPETLTPALSQRERESKWIGFKDIMPEIIVHLDADCFYCSAERVRHPHLRHMPVGVLGNHGACIIAKSAQEPATSSRTRWTSGHWQCSRRAGGGCARWR